MATVSKLEALIPVLKFSGADYGAEAVQNKLIQQGWAAGVTPQVGAKKLRVVLKKWGKPQRNSDGSPNFTPFDDVEGLNAIAAAAAAYSTLLPAFREWAVQTTAAAIELKKDLSPTEILKTSGREIVEQGTIYQQKLAECKAKGGYFCALTAAGVPTWLPPVVIGLGALYVLAQLATIKRAFLGGTK